MRHATRIALEGIRKVAWYEGDVEPNKLGSNNDDRDPAFLIKGLSSNSTTKGDLSDINSSIAIGPIDEDASLSEDFFKTPSSETMMYIVYLHVH